MTYKKDLKDIKKYSLDAETRISEFSKKINKETQNKAHDKMIGELSFGIYGYDELSTQRNMDVAIASLKVNKKISDFAVEEIKGFINLYTTSVIDSNPDFSNFIQVVNSRKGLNKEPFILINNLWNYFKHNEEKNASSISGTLGAKTFWEYISIHSKELEEMVSHEPEINFDNSPRII